MPRRRSRRLVIDADVARSAGGEDAIYPRSKFCRDFLISVRKVCHHVVMTPEIADEWKRHRSRFASQWRVSMEARRKVHHLTVRSNDDLREKIGRIAGSEKSRDAMLKDVHLIEVAMATDQVIISLDETARELFTKATVNVGELRKIVWVNPEKTEEEPVVWLENGARTERKRQLAFRIRDR